MGSYLQPRLIIWSFSSSSLNFSNSKPSIPSLAQLRVCFLNYPLEMTLRFVLSQSAWFLIIGKIFFEYSYNVMNYGHIHSPFLTSSFPNPWTTPIIFMSLSLSLMMSRSCGSYVHGCRTIHYIIDQGHGPREKWLFNPQLLSTASGSSARRGPCRHLLHPWWNFDWFDLVQVLCR